MLPDLHNVFPAGTQRNTAARHWNGQAAARGQLDALQQRNTLQEEEGKEKNPKHKQIKSKEITVQEAK